MSLAGCVTLLLLGISVIALSATVLRLIDDLQDCINGLKALGGRVEELDIRTDALDGIIQRIERK